jgi:ABC-type amino acid transport substrate-binding protein
MLVASLLAACQPVQQPQASAAAAADMTPTASPVVAYDAATDWQRIEESGRLVVGTAADYAPFEYYDGSFQLAGFDPALMRAIGAQLGVEVLFKDFALESLADALALGQIDVAAAALTVTPERRAIIDFSQPYFASTEGILAQPDDVGSITKVADLAGKRIGVERGSIYESWLRSQLVDTGVTLAENLMKVIELKILARHIGAKEVRLHEANPALELTDRAAQYLEKLIRLVQKDRRLTLRPDRKLLITLRSGEDSVEEVKKILMALQ